MMMLATCGAPLFPFSGQWMGLQAWLTAYARKSVLQPLLCVTAARSWLHLTSCIKRGMTVVQWVSRAGLTPSQRQQSLLSTAARHCPGYKQQGCCAWHNSGRSHQRFQPAVPTVGGVPLHTPQSLTAVAVASLPACSATPHPQKTHQHRPGSLQHTH
jgi:hypothetical protein